MSDQELTPKRRRFSNAGFAQFVILVAILPSVVDYSLFSIFDPALEAYEWTTVESLRSDVSDVEASRVKLKSEREVKTLNLQLERLRRSPKPHPEKIALLEDSLRVAKAELVDEVDIGQLNLHTSNHYAQWTVVLLFPIALFFCILRLRFLALLGLAPALFHFVFYLWHMADGKVLPNLAEWLDPEWFMLAATVGFVWFLVAGRFFSRWTLLALIVFPIILVYATPTLDSYIQSENAGWGEDFRRWDLGGAMLPVCCFILLVAIGRFVGKVVLQNLVVFARLGPVQSCIVSVKATFLWMPILLFAMPVFLINHFSGVQIVKTVYQSGVLTPVGTTEPKPKLGDKASVEFEFYGQDEFDKLPDALTSKLPRFASYGVAPQTSGVITKGLQEDLWGLEVPEGAESSRFACRFRGFLEIEQTGEYAFPVDYDRAFIVDVDGVSVTTGTGAGAPSQNSVYLTKGIHEVAVEFVHDPSAKPLKVEFGDDDFQQPLAPQLRKADYWWSTSFHVLAMGRDLNEPLRQLQGTAAPIARRRGPGRRGQLPTFVQHARRQRALAKPVQLTVLDVATDPRHPSFLTPDNYRHSVDGNWTSDSRRVIVPPSTQRINVGNSEAKFLQDGLPVFVLRRLDDKDDRFDQRFIDRLDAAQIDAYQSHYELATQPGYPHLIEAFGGRPKVQRGIQALQTAKETSSEKQEKPKPEDSSLLDDMNNTVEEVNSDAKRLVAWRLDTAEYRIKLQLDQLRTKVTDQFDKMIAKVEANSDQSALMDEWKNEIDAVESSLIQSVDDALPPDLVGAIYTESPSGWDWFSISNHADHAAKKAVNVGLNMINDEYRLIRKDVMREVTEQAEALGERLEKKVDQVGGKIKTTGGETTEVLTKKKKETLNEIAKVQAALTAQFDETLSTLFVVFDAEETVTKYSVDKAFAAARAIGYFGNALFIFLCLRTYLYVFARVAFAQNTRVGITLKKVFGRMPRGEIIVRGRSFTIDPEDGQEYYVARKYEPQGCPPRFWLPQAMSAVLPRLRSGTYFMNRVSAAGRQQVSVEAADATKFVEWKIEEGETVVFDYRNLVAVSDNVRLGSIFSYSISSLLCGRILFPTASGPGTIVLSTAGMASVGEEANDSVAPSQLVAWQQNTEFYVDSELNMVDLYFSGFYLKRQPDDLVIVTADKVGKARTGITRFIKYFLTPV